MMQKCGRVDEQIALLKHKLKLIYLGEAFNGKPTKTARSHGKKFQVSIKQETSRILVSEAIMLFLYYNEYIHNGINCVVTGELGLGIHAQVQLPGSRGSIP